MFEPRSSLRRRVGKAAERWRLDSTIKGAVLRSTWATERLAFMVYGAPRASDTILLAGSGRSGTTWLADLIAAQGPVQQVFEPLNPTKLREAMVLSGWGSEDQRHHIRSVYLRPGAESPEWEEFLGRVLEGRVRNWWTESGRTAFVPKHFLIKLIRGNLMLGFTYDAYRPRIVLQLRHPCAVVSSRLRGSWHADVNDLLRQDALVEDYLKPWLPQVEQERDELGAHAVSWAVESAVALNELRSRPHWLVLYEDLVTEPERELRAIREWLGLATGVPRRNLVNRPSRTTHPREQVSRAHDRISFWRTHLSHDDRQRILRWVRRLGVDWYDDSPLPVRSPRPQGRNRG